MVLTPAEREKASQTYFAEMDKCAAAACYWALLHLVVTMPDICAALEHPRGDTTGNTGPCYEAWCTRYWNSAIVPPSKRWEIRCALLHQGRTILKSGDTFSYIRPGPPGSKTHEFVNPGEQNTTLEVDKLATEVKNALNAWFSDLQAPAN